MKQNMIIIAVLVAVVALGAGFFGGMKYQQSKRPAFNRDLNNVQGARTGNGVDRMAFRPVTGEIISVDDKSITVKLNDGSSKFVLLTDNTQINKASEVKKEELKAGEKVSVFGTQNSDGSVTAQSVQLNPIFENLNK